MVHIRIPAAAAFGYIMQNNEATFDNGLTFRWNFAQTLLRYC